MNDYVAQISIKNGKLLAKMRAAGLSVMELSKASGVGHGIIYRLLSMSLPAAVKSGEWRSSVLRISETLRCLPEDIIPQAQVHAALAKNKAEVGFTADDVSWMIASHPDKRIAIDQAGGIIRDVLKKSLSPRYVSVIEARFGFNGPEKTYEEIAKDMKVTRGRVRQMEQTALRRLRWNDRERGLSIAFDAFKEETP